MRKNLPNVLEINLYSADLFSFQLSKVTLLNRGGTAPCQHSGNTGGQLKKGIREGALGCKWWAFIGHSPSQHC